ncbi:hypothetical protein ABFS82_09G057200 [Erythranthe guttata]|uniref:BTB/POZ domain-containing protein At5g17580-like n=1 Tax=Erythranthe guttata TaxID=4155 RepID=UPI00064DD3B2|nr:PREDICTED: BTB/POZ domain-containing protein At5g17580-like [Erythranthe guttata]|eukprot:XP_012829398.1 PREDICTED: BTB/POZ domain-containing protein At5g17580-like [Erythranthe guttata]
MAAARKGIECSTWRTRSKLTSELQLHICGSLFTLDKELLATKSSKIAKLIQRNPNNADLSNLLRDIPADRESMEIVRRFCHGIGANLTPENIVRISCVAKYLGMTDDHCPDNLLTKALTFFECRVIPSWNNSVRALKNAENILDHASELGLVDYCAKSIISKAMEDPRLLGESIKINIPISDGEDSNEENVYKPNARRKLFDIEWKSEDLSLLGLRLYAPLINAMIQRKIPQENIAANICQYAKTWLFSDEEKVDETSRREILEALVQLLPHERYMVTCTFLFNMLRYAKFLDASSDCINGLELRIGKQLDQASVKDMMLILSQGYAKDENYDTECVRRILKNFYMHYTGRDPTGLGLVAELIDEFLIEISANIDLKMEIFVAFADMSVAASEGILSHRTSDGVYRAVDIYLDKHRHLTESEKEEICRVLNCNRLSGGACEHAAQNERLPVRFVVQALYVAQLKLREAIVPRIVGGGGSENSNSGFVKREEEEEGERMEIERMESKVKELERECNVMRREIERGGGCCNCGSGFSNYNNVVKKNKNGKMSMWKEMKRKFGCGISMYDDCHCHVKKKKKVHPR